MRYLAFIAAGLVCAQPVHPAQAVEDATPYLPGATLGVPLGLLPPPGLYMSAFASHFSFRGHNDNGNATPARIGATPAGVTFTYVNDFRVFGASYALGITQPIRYQTLDTPALSADQLGFVNTVLNLGTLSWRLGGDLNVSVGQDLYVKDGSYRVGTLVPAPVTAPVSVGRNYWTYQPRLALTYLRDGWSFTNNAMLNVNTENLRTRYQSGTLFINETTLLRRIGLFELGVASVFVNQISDDRLFGRIVGAVPSGRGYGNKVEYASIGPVIGYSPGPFSIQLYYQANVVARNGGGGSQVWGRLSMPLITSRPSSPAEVDAAGPR